MAKNNDKDDAPVRVRLATYTCPECGSKLTVRDGFVRCTNNDGEGPTCDFGIRRTVTVEQFNEQYRAAKED